MIEDYFFTCYKMERETVADGLGGYEVVFYRGVSFKGLPTKNTPTEQVVGALRGQEKATYKFSCEKNMPLQKDDVIEWTDESGIDHYIRLTSNAIHNTAKSSQDYWKLFEAEEFDITTIAVRNNV